MMTQAASCGLAVALASWCADPAAALVIYRFGGRDLPPPAAADSAGVRFEQLDWDRVDASRGGRLFEMEVGARIAALRRDPNVNIAPLQAQQGGLYWHGEKNGAVWDGDPATAWINDPYLCATTFSAHLVCVDDFGSLGTVNVLLGSGYRIDRLRVHSGLHDASQVAQAFRVFLAPEAPGYPWHPANPPRPFEPRVAEVRDNRDTVVELQMPPNDDTRFVQVAFQEHLDTWAIHEIEVFASGFVERSTWVSDVLDLGRPMALGELRWSGRVGELATAQIQTRSGTDEDPVRHWRYIGRGQDREEVSAATYAQLKPGERAGKSDDQQRWSPWAPYEFGDSLGTAVLSPGPRRYVQARVDFLPREQDGGHLEVLELRVSPPLATSLTGEVWPIQAPVGEVTRFTYALLPNIGAGEAGFDRLELRSESLLGDVRQVRVGDMTVPFEVDHADSHRVALRLPRIGPADSGALVEVDFDARVLRYGVGFRARVWDSAQPLEEPQSVVAGDATGQYEGDGVRVATAVGARAVLRVASLPRWLSPNGDGVHDVATTVYEILEITGRARVQVEVLDLAGRRVRLLTSEPRGVGRYAATWDGLDDARRQVAPGLYLVRVTARTRAAVTTRTAVLAVAY